MKLKLGYHIHIKTNLLLFDVLMTGSNTCNWSHVCIYRKFTGESGVLYTREHYFNNLDIL